MSNEEYDKKLDQFTIELLDAYCASRSPHPGNSELGEPLAPDNKTTDDIADELAPSCQCRYKTSSSTCATTATASPRLPTAPYAGRYGATCTT